ncbi:MAG: hypothetical protein F6J86_13215 [Symploca sp. SIO1B1]|nr:hypothetical protein [Symploca sp. SIO1C2]NER47289.1 hypothetical protein [Symploca sp. SIO1A3]NER94778.1 hypothetical protein [Symploca sp. SIO1B1]
MRQVALIGLLSFLAMFTGSCTIGGQDEVEQTAIPSPSVSPSPNVSPSPTPFESPVEPAKTQVPPAAAGLISSLPPEERIKQISQGRNDPFAAIPVQPEVQVDSRSGGRGAVPQPVPGIPRVPQPQNKGNPSTTKTKPQATAPKATAPKKKTTPQATAPKKKTTPQATVPKKGNTPQATAPKKGNTPQATAPKKTTTPQPKVSPPKPSNPPSSNNPTSPDSPIGLEPDISSVPEFIPQLPEIPEATLARQIKVEGVVQVNEQPSAIVKVPDRPSQYVKEGQRLYNGQVLVKRIEANRGPTPVVILEENGVEVIIGVGEEPTGGPEEGGSQTASIPAIKLGVGS